MTSCVPTFASPVLPIKRKSTSPGPLTRRMKSALFPDELKLTDPKSLTAQMGAVEAEDEHADADFQPGAQRQCRIIDARPLLIASLRTARRRVRGGGGVRRGPDR